MELRPQGLERVALARAVGPEIGYPILIRADYRLRRLSFHLAQFQYSDVRAPLVRNGLGGASKRRTE